jgi:regulator of RNase E activity RraA
MATTTVPLKPGFRLVKGIQRPSADLVAQIGQFPSANVSDVQGRQLTMSSAVRPLSFPNARIAGPAVTVKARPGDNLMAMKAIDLAQPGDVIIISSDGEANLSVWGGIMATMAVRRGIAAVVTDGIVRDIEQVRRAGLPIWATGLTPAGPTKLGPGQINLPVSCGGVIVNPGDVVLADADGVVVVPQSELEAVIGRAHVRVRKEQGWLERIAQDDYSVLVDSDEALRALGCEIMERL